MDINTIFTRTLLNNVMEDVRLVTTIEERKTAWTYHFMRDDWEFHGPHGFYWHGKADNGWHARAQGWMAYLNQCAAKQQSPKEC